MRKAMQKQGMIAWVGDTLRYSYRINIMQED